jgi:predicted O-methyltransferase YrrM
MSTIGAGPINGPFSAYLNGTETALLIALVRSARPKVMIEFGCNAGQTAKNVLDNVRSIERYVGVDVPFGHRPALDCQRSEIPRYPGAHAATDHRFWLLTKANGSAGLKPEDLEPIDAAFIDGDHSYAGVMHDSRLARALLRPGGIIVWHDYQNPAVEVTAALDELHGNGWPIECIQGSWLAFMRA